MSPQKVRRAAEDEISLTPLAAQQNALSDSAKNVPPVKRTNDEAKFARGSLVRNAFVHVIELYKSPSYTMEAWSWLDSHIHGSTERPDDSWGER